MKIFNCDKNGMHVTNIYVTNHSVAYVFTILYMLSSHIVEQATNGMFIL